MNAYLNLADNPLFIKHVRSRMRRATVLPSVIMVCFFSLCIVVLEMKVFEPDLGIGSHVFFWMQGIILLLMGGSQVAAAVAAIKETGMIDFHRIAPVPARVQVLGFLLGAPIREWTLFACTLPFSLFLALTGPWGLVGFTKVLLVQITGALLYHALGLVTGLAGKSARGASGRIVGIIVILNIVSSNLTEAGVPGPTLLSPIPVYRQVTAEAAEAIRKKKQIPVPPGPAFGPAARNNPWAGVQRDFEPRFYAIDIPLVIQTLVFQGSIFIFLMIGGTRRFRSNRLPLYTKPQALAFMATVTFLTLGSLWETSAESITLATAYFLTFMAFWLTATVTPSVGEFSKGLQRARRLGSLQIPVWNDLASNKVATLVMGAFILVALTLANVAAPGPPGPPIVAGAKAFEPWGPMAVAVLSVLSFGWALQYFNLRYERRAQSFFGLYIFMVWIVPIVVGSLAAASGAKGAAVFAGISPFAGIAFAGLRNLGPIDPTVLQLFSIAPPAILTGLFGALLLTEERRRAVLVQKEHEVKHPDEESAAKRSDREVIE